MKLPEIPGSIMAQLAIAPDMTTNQDASVVVAGVTLVI